VLEWNEIERGLALSATGPERGTMGYTQVALEEKLLQMYPEIQEQGIAMSLSFNEDKNAWIVRLEKDGQELTTHLEKKDADECMDGFKCVYLGVQVGQFVKNFEEKT
jgi:hypothetical protein